MHRKLICKSLCKFFFPTLMYGFSFQSECQNCFKGFMNNILLLRVPNSFELNELIHHTKKESDLIQLYVYCSFKLTCWNSWTWYTEQILYTNVKVHESCIPLNYEYKVSCWCSWYHSFLIAKNSLKYDLYAIVNQILVLIIPSIGWLL